MRILLLKAVDLIAGNLLARLLPPPASRSGRKGSPESVLVIRPGGIGDAVLLAPAIHLLAARFPGVAIDILAERRNAAVFQLIPGIRQLFVYDKPADLLKTIRSSYDLVIDTEQWHRLSAVIARLTGAPQLIGYATNIRRRLFTDDIPYSHEDYESGSFFHLLAPLGINAPSVLAAPFLFLPDSAREEAERLLGRDAAVEYVVLFPGASIPERRWGADRFRGVAEQLIADGLQVVVVGGRDDYETAEQIVSGGNGVNLAGRTSLAGTAAVIAGARVLVSGDSGILHLGVGLNVPTVSFFGPGIAAKWAPGGAHHIVLNLNISCSPCTRFGYTPRCPINVRCLAEISAADVVAAARKLLNGRPQMKEIA